MLLSQANGNFSFHLPVFVCLFVFGGGFYIFGFVLVKNSMKRIYDQKDDTAAKLKKKRKELFQGNYLKETEFP